MKQIINYEDMFLFLNNVTSKVNFKYNGINYGAMIANDGKVIVKNFKTSLTVGKKQFLEQISTSYTPIRVEVDTTSDNETPIAYKDYKQCFISPATIDNEFIEFLQIKEFETEYKNHKNIGLFDFDKLKELYPHLRLRNKKNVLFFENGKYYNISVKWSSNNSWTSVKGTKASIGAFFKAEKATSTLILCEGLKDSINANIAFPTADILAVNGKSNSYNFKLYGIDLQKYKQIIFANDRDVKDSEFIKMFSSEYKTHYKKTKILDWSKIEKGKDLSDIIEHIVIKKCKTKRDRTRSALPTLKKLLKKDNFLEKYTIARIKEGEKALDKAIEIDNKDMVMRAIKTLNIFSGDILKGASYYLDRQNKVNNENITNIELGENNRLSDHAGALTSVINSNNKIFLNAPTGTGKSYVSLQVLPKYYKNIVIIAPLRMVTNEHGGKETPYTNVRFDDNYNAIQADMNSNYIAVTTDAFVKLKSRFKAEFEYRLNKADLIIFDEQHLYYDSLGFRDDTVVSCYDFLMHEYSNKVLFMSGTPIIPNGDVAVVKATVLEKNKEDIKFYYNPFNDTNEIIESIKDEIKKGAILIYVNSRAKVSELQNLLSDIETLAITSFSYKLNNKEVDSKILDNDLGNIVYISTTKATTGVNFKYLRAIYQYGTPYTPNTFIQLMARLRNGGKYFVIEPQYAVQREQYNAKRAIGLSLAFKKMDIKKVGDSFYGDDFQDWLRKFVLLSHNNKNLQGFYKTYRKAFQLIEAKGLGKFNEKNDDFIFSGHEVKNISSLFEFDDKNEFRKYIEQVIIDWILRNSVEMLNTHYNLSFRIINATLKASEEKHHLITEEDRQQKAESRAEHKDEIEELYLKIDEKLKDIDITAKLLKKNKFTDSELSKLNDIKIHTDKLKDIKDYRDKIIALKFHLIPKSAIFKIANELILSNGFITAKELDSKLQEIFITNARSKYPYEKLLIELFTNDFFNNQSYLEFSKTKRVNRTLKYNILTVSKEHIKEFEAIRTKRAKKKYLDKKSKELQKNIEVSIYKPQGVFSGRIETAKGDVFVNAKMIDVLGNKWQPNFETKLYEMVS